MNQRIEDYLSKLENDLLNGKWQLVETNYGWTDKFQSTAGVYVVKEEGEICYVGETGNLKKRMRDLLDTRNHSLRRTIGCARFAGKEGYEIATPSRKFPPQFEEELNRFFEDNFEVSAIEVLIGRKELEERLVEKFKPKYNTREKRKSDESEKAYSITEIRKSHENAYKPWTTEDDTELVRLEKEGKSIGEIASIFGRNRGAINSRLNKIRERR
ncbi:MAG TPA: GIY-YIG nuclease family protein [Saprospiraceae bacterium]|nr:GIY-YIG nuclease family protein [Saprospiraceae bacterium]